MKFGIFYELQLPRPWVAGDELKLYQDALMQLETADRLGYDHAWVVEHHFLEEYSHSPSPESFLAAASQRTRNIRLGHGIFQLTTNHPARVAERVAVLDLLSNGRVEFGMGESASITELTPFGRDMETKKEVFEEAVRAITRRYGWPARSFRPSNAPAGTGLARSASSSSARMPRMPGCTPITMRSRNG
jgi:alkanesulfonate monooxygenase SsuD/methylene tetrahydromethanopterin reductase-like flavin-dependent oxidoreductase (luciferase family)